jgi:uncharacterized membrane protein YdfJ with MMPL/SSD domain
MLAALTLLPVLLGSFGHRLRLPATATDEGDHGWFARVARVVQRRAAVVAVVVGGGACHRGAVATAARKNAGSAHGTSAPPTYPRPAARRAFSGTPTRGVS